MRHICCLLLAAFAINISSPAQARNPTPPPQTARQALIEMFLGSDADALAKHLPENARPTLIRKGETSETSMVQRISLLVRQMSTQGEHIETFDIGPTLLASEKGEGKEKIKTEVLVEHDSFMGETDEIELSIHMYRNGQPEFLPVIPQLIFSMTQEKEIWRLTEITLAAHIPLTDPDYLKGIRKQTDAMDENMASMRISMIASAEIRYSSNHPDRGYTCALTGLFGQGDTTDAPAQPDEVYTPAAAAGDDSSGYHFSISGCQGNPASKFQITAVPIESDSEMKAFCADESGTVRFDANGRGSACLTRGQVLNPETSNRN
jgi:hypothetical protein